MLTPLGPMSATEAQERRDTDRQPLPGSVRLIVLSEEDQPIMERHGEGVNVTAEGLAVSVRIPLALGTRMVVCFEVPQGRAVWHVRVVHVLHHEHHRVLGLKRLDVPESLANAQWIRTLSALT